MTETDPSVTHGDFHKRPGFQSGLEVLYCPCEEPLINPDPDCRIHGINPEVVDA